MNDFFHATQKSGSTGKALNHSRYIMRAGHHGKRRPHDLVATVTENFPAGVSEREYWQTADKTGRNNGVAYREWEVALPRCLDAAQNKELFVELTTTLAEGRPVQAALHCPKAALEGGDQWHSHIMISPCIPDGIERPLEQIHRRYCPSAPAKGGCRKAGGALTLTALKEELIAKRKVCADVINKHLAANGFDERVDHRSNADRGLPPPTQRHLGPVRVQRLLAEKGHDAEKKANV